MTEVSDSWAVLETHGFPPEAVGWPARNIAGLLPEAIEAAISTLIRQREDLLAEVLQLRSPIQPQCVRAALQTIKDICAGDRVPNWKDDWQTTHSRGRILDLCDAALSHTRPECGDAT